MFSKSIIFATRQTPVCGTQHSRGSREYVYDLLAFLFCILLRIFFRLTPVEDLFEQSEFRRLAFVQPTKIFCYKIQKKSPAKKKYAPCYLPGMFQTGPRPVLVAI